MRLICITCILIYLNVSLGYAQNRISVPVLKENKSIDKLMNIILDPKNPNKFVRSNNSTDSCFMLNFFKSGDNVFSFQIEKNTKAVIDTIINLRTYNHNNVGYFRYRNYKVFVYAMGSFYDFFKQTSDLATFDFINKTSGIYGLSDEYYLVMWHYQYANGRFSVEGPPPVKQLEKN